MSRIERAGEEPFALGVHVRLLFEGDLEQASDGLFVRVSEIVAVLRLLVRDLDPGALQVRRDAQGSAEWRRCPARRICILASIAALTR